MIKYFLMSLLLVPTCVFALEPGKVVIPQDPNLRPYSAVVGQDEQGKWQILGLKSLGDGRYGLDVGSVTTQVVGSITAVLEVEKPISIFEPRIWGITNTQLVGTNTVYIFSVTGNNIYTEPHYANYVEYIIIIRNEFLPIDYYSFEFYREDRPDEFLLGAEVSPASGQSVFRPYVPIRLDNNKGFYIFLRNKSEYPQKFRIGIVLSQRRID